MESTSSALSSDTNEAFKNSAGKSSVDVRVCNICGDAARGWLAVCSKCKDGAEHIYCMRIPMDELPDSSWMCEECALLEQKDKMKSVQSIAYETRRAKFKSWAENELFEINSKRPTLKGKRTKQETSKASSRQDIAFSGGFSKSKSSNDSDKRPKVLPLTEAPQTQELRITKKVSSEMKLAHSLRGADNSSSSLERNATIQDGENSDNASFRQLATFAFPDLDYIWRGIFEIQPSNRLPKVIHGIQAHISSLASPRVPDAVKKFSSTISLEEVSRVNAWPAQFQELGPQDDSIALYFFPRDTASYSNHRNLVHLMTHYDLALRGNVGGGIEILVFSSTVLPEGSRFWNGSLYLWCVFRGRKVAEPQLAV